MTYRVTYGMSDYQNSSKPSLTMTPYTLKVYENLFQIYKRIYLAIFEPLLAPKLKFIFPGLCEDAEYQLTFKENKKNQFDLIFSRRSLLVVACAGACGGAYLYNQHWLANNIIGLCFAIQVSCIFRSSNCISF